MQFVLYTVANAACLLPPPRPSPTGEGGVWWATAERSPQRGGSELQTAPSIDTSGFTVPLCLTASLPDTVMDTDKSVARIGGDYLPGDNKTFYYDASSKQAAQPAKGG